MAKGGCEGEECGQDILQMLREQLSADLGDMSLICLALRLWFLGPLGCQMHCSQLASCPNVTYASRPLITRLPFSLIATLH